MKRSLLAFMFMMSMTCLYAKDTLIVGNSGSYYPFGFVKGGVLQGFEIDLMRAIGKKIGKKVVFKQANFSGLFGLLESGRIDLIANQVTLTPKRLERYLFSLPYTYSGTQIFVNSKNTSIKTTRDLINKTVGVQFGTNFEGNIRALPYSDKIKVKVYQSASFMDVSLGRIDAFIEDKIVGLEMIKKNKRLKIKLASNKPFVINKQAYPMLKENHILLVTINEALYELSLNGTLTGISQKWFGEDVTQPR